MINLRTIRSFLLGMVMAVVVVGVGIAPVHANQGNPLFDLNLTRFNRHIDNVEAIGDFAPLVIPAAAFTSDGVDPDGFWFSFSGFVDGNDTACLKAPAYLPQGAIVTGLYASLYDNYTSDIFVTLYRVNVGNGTSNALAEVSSTGQSTVIQLREDTSVNYADINYPTYAYYVTTCLNSVDHRLYSVRIYYEQRIFLPIVKK